MSIHTISIKSDSDGFITLECPYCKGRFKLTVDFLEERSIIDLFCPHCGLKHELVNFLMREDVIEQAEILAHNLIADMLGQFSKDLERNISSKHISFTAGEPIASKAEKNLWEREEMEILTLKCCNFQIKLDRANHQHFIYCPECGVM
jgi:uncharacterized protein YbaR (Trm112 family)